VGVPLRQSIEAFAERRRKHWRLNHSPLFLDFLEGKVEFECTPWEIMTTALRQSLRAAVSG